MDYFRGRTTYPESLKRRANDIGVKFLSIIQAYSDACQRCGNPSHPLYPHYGGKGITIGFSRLEFAQWYVENYPSARALWPSQVLTLSRIDHDKNYTFSNLRLEPRELNTQEAWHRRGNPSPHGTKLDNIQALVIHTFNNGYAMAKHYGVAASTANRILKGVTHKHIYEALHDE